MNKAKTWKFLAERKVAEFNELDIERREMLDAKKLIEEKISFVAEIIEEQQVEEINKDAVFRLDGIHKTRQVYLSQLRNMHQGLVTQTMDVELKISKIRQQMEVLQIEKQRYEKLEDLSNKKLARIQTQLEQKDSDQFALQNFLQKSKTV